MNPHNLRKLEKRKKTNRENLVRSFSRDQFQLKIYGDSHKYLDLLPADELLKFMRLYLHHRDAVDNILTYVRRFKQAVGELEVDDIEAAKAMLAVKSVMED
jgi:hypothetical protein